MDSGMCSVLSHSNLETRQDKTRNEMKKEKTRKEKKRKKKMIITKFTTLIIQQILSIIYFCQVIYLCACFIILICFFNSLHTCINYPHQSFTIKLIPCGSVSKNMSCIILHSSCLIPLETYLQCNDTSPEEVFCFKAYCN